jgi:uncharacterized Rossmann fold enzyme
MDFKQWEPIYQEILRDFGWERKKDEDAAQVLSRFLQGRYIDLEVVRGKIEGKNVLICGKSSSLSSDLEKIDFKNFVIIAADGATSMLMKKGKVPDIIVTDLDGYLPDEIEANRKGALMVVHAHGDNINKLIIVKKLKNVMGTSQSAPLHNVYNFGGLSDGDRCVFLAHVFGARNIILAGFNFDDENVTEIKKKKLKWAKKLLGQVPEIKI